jgi:hypothetical protein
MWFPFNIVAYPNGTELVTEAGFRIRQILEKNICSIAQF